MLTGSIPIDNLRMFPFGAYAAGGFEPVRDFEQSNAARTVQATDRSSGEPLWQLDVIDADPNARNRTVRVKIAGNQQPTLPPASPGTPFVPVEFAGLAVVPYVSQAGRIAYALRAEGVCAPARSSAHPVRETPDAA